MYLYHLVSFKIMIQRLRLTPCAMVRPWAIYVYFSIKRYGHPLITRGQCTGESHHFCAISVLLKNHHTMVQR